MLALVAIGVGAGSIVIAEGALHPANRGIPPSAFAEAVARASGACWQDARVTARDGTELAGWLFSPATGSNGSAVVLMHGVGDTRLGVLAHAGYLLRSGFAVLTPDSRAHGASGGRFISYGVLEALDVSRWADWLAQKPGIRRLYGLGESMGAAILLESLPREPRLRAVVAECPFSTFEDARYRLAQRSGLPPVLVLPIVRFGFFYANWRYRVDLRQATSHSLRRPV